MILVDTKVKTLKLSELTSQIKEALDTAFTKQIFLVVAEVSNFKKTATGYYFDFIEKSEGSVLAKIKANVWRNNFSKISAFEQATGQKFDSGLQVLLHVRVNYHEVYDMSLVVMDVDASYSLGQIELQRRMTLERLVKENPDHIKFINGKYETRNKLLPPRPIYKRIAVVSSSQSDGYKDFIHELTNNLYGFKYTTRLFESSVQGTQAEDEILGALRDIFKMRANFDAIVVVRGGGSQTDFSAFDSYQVCRALAIFPLTVFTGIGHTRNETIADLMAAYPLKTPTKVASFLVENTLGVWHNLEQTVGAIKTMANQQIVAHKNKFNVCCSDCSSLAKTYLERHLNKVRETGKSIRVAVQFQLNNNRTLIGQVQSKIKFAVRVSLQARGEELRYLSSSINLLHPFELIRKGYGLLLKNGIIVKDDTEVVKGEDYTLCWKDLTLTITIKNINSKSNEL